MDGKPQRRRCPTATESDSTAVLHPWQGLTDFSSLTYPNVSRSLDLHSNHITSFVGFPQLLSLTQLSLDSNPITSYQGCQLLPSLRWLSLRGTPISRNFDFKLMCLVAFGSQIVSINSETITPALKKRAEVLKSELFF
jgi:hypothetical protein